MVIMGEFAQAPIKSSDGKCNLYFVVGRHYSAPNSYQVFLIISEKVEIKAPNPIVVLVSPSKNPESTLRSPVRKALTFNHPKNPNGGEA